MPEENPTIPIKQLVENDSRFYPLTSANAVFFEDSSYLSSKPFATGVLTINLNGSQAGTFSANGANNQTINIQAASAANLLSLVASASYNSNTKKIEFFNTASTKLCDIDASAFIKDGMIDSVSIGNGTGANASKSCLLIDFNTDAESGGHTDIEIPLEGIFNPANYYTKTETDSTFVAQTDYDDDSEVVAAALNDLNGRIVTLESTEPGDANVIETVKVNNTALTVTNKAVNITVPTTLASLTDDSTHRLVTDTEKTTWNGKANTASPTFTGTPTAPTAAAGTNNTQIATTAFVQTAVSKAASKGALNPSIFGEFSFSGSTFADIPLNNGTTVNATKDGLLSDGGTTILSSDIENYVSSTTYPIVKISVTVEGTSSSDPGYTSEIIFTDFSTFVSNGLIFTNAEYQIESNDVKVDNYYFKVVLDWNDTNVKLFLYKRNATTVTSTYSSTGTDAVNGTAVASALSSYVTNTEFNNDARVVSAALNDLNDRLGDTEDASNKVTSLSSSSTDTEYPSAKAVYDAIQNSGSDDSEHAVKIDSTCTVNVSNASSTRIFSLSDVKYAGCAIHMINTSQFFGYGNGDIVFGISNSTGDTYLAFVQYRDNESTTIKFVLSVNGTITQSSSVGNVEIGSYAYLSNLLFSFDFATKQAFFTYKYGASTAISSANFSSWDLSGLSNFKFVVTTSDSTAVAQISVNDFGWNLTPYNFSCEYGHYNVGKPTSYSENIYLAGTGITTSGTITQNISNTDKIISVSASEPTAFSLYPSNIVNQQDYSYYCLKIRFSSVSSDATIDSYYAGYWRPSYQDTGSLSNHTPVVNTDYYIGVFNPGDVNYMSDAFTITGDMTFEVSEPYYYNPQAQNICADTWNGNVFTGSIPFNSGKYPQNVFITKGIHQSTNTPTKYVPSGTIIVVSGNAYMYISGTWKQINNT